MIPLDNIYREIVEFLVDHKSLEELKGNLTGKGITVGIIDSGIDSTHSFLEGSIIDAVEFRETGDDIEAVKKNPGMNDASGHGTGCAGIIKKIAPDIKIVDLKVLGENTSGKFTTFLKGIEYAIENNIKVINMSLGTVRENYIMPLLKMTQRAYEKDIIIVAAADNRKRVMYPSAFPSVISVDIGEDIETFDSIILRPENIIDFGGYGSYVETCGLNNEYVKMFGTSFATPHVTGLVSLLLERWPFLTVKDISFILNYFSIKN